MKTKITKVVALFTTLAIIFSCTEDMEYRDTAVSPVNQLYEPISGKSVCLLYTSSAKQPQKSSPLPVCSSRESLQQADSPYYDK